MVASELRKVFSELRALRSRLHEVEKSLVERNPAMKVSLQLQDLLPVASTKLNPDAPVFTYLNPQLGSSTTEARQARDQSNRYVDLSSKHKELEGVGNPRKKTVKVVRFLEEDEDETKHRDLCTDVLNTKQLISETRDGFEAKQKVLEGVENPIKEMENEMEHKDYCVGELNTNQLLSKTEKDEFEAKQREIEDVVNHAMLEIAKAVQSLGENEDSCVDELNTNQVQTEMKREDFVAKQEDLEGEVDPIRDIENAIEHEDFCAEELNTSQLRIDTKERCDSHHTGQGFLAFLTCEDIAEVQAVSHHHFDIVAGEEDEDGDYGDDDGWND